MAPHRIVKVEKPGWRIYYDCDARYPVCVVEAFDGRLPGAPIRRSDVGEPFRADTAVPKRYRMYWREYEDYMVYGGSPGHNAPASFHKSGLTDYRRTFLLSNICPQEVVFNGGRWVLLESLCKEVVAAFPRTVVLTGSVPAARERAFGASRINVPTHMYKVIIATSATGQVYSACYLMPNRPGTDEVPIDRFLIEQAALEDKLCRASGFDLRRIIGSAGGTGARPLALVHGLVPEMTDTLRGQMRASRLHGRLVYSETLEELEATYARIASPSKYHRLYYERARERILRGAAVSKKSK